MHMLADKVAIVTGAGSGIGRASAVLFAEQGARVVAFDMSSAVHETVDLIVAAGGAAIGIEGDAGHEPDVQSLVQDAVARFGSLSIFFANAGISGPHVDGIFDADPAVWMEVLRVNLLGPVLAIKHGAPIIRASGSGAMLCTASVAGLRSGAGAAHYSASKAGVINLVQVAAQQLAGSGVRINALCPGLIETGMTKFAYDRARDSGKLDSMGDLNPLGRGGEAEEVAAAALFLVSDAASYIHGQSIAVDGGLSSSLPTVRRPLDIARRSQWV